MIRPISLLCFLAVVSPRSWAQPKIVAVVNAASYQDGLPYGGALAIAYVSGLAGLKPGTYTAPLSQPLPYQLGGIQVFVNGALAPVLAAAIPSDPSADIQVNFQVPAERNASLFPGGSINGGYITGGSFGVNQATAPLPGAPVWGGFFRDARGYANALHASDSSSVTVQNPAHPGESIIVYADDFFITWPPPPVGIPAPTQIPFQLVNFAPRDSGYLYLQTYPPPTPCPFPENPLTCTQSITNTPALKITFEGLALGQVGVEEIDFVVPANQQPGNWALFFNATSCPDGSGVPGTCGASPGSSSPYVLLPVGGASVTAGPVINSITDQATNQSCNVSQDPTCTLTASQNDVLEIDGIGFSPAGGNTIHFVGSGGDWWFYEQDGYFFSDASHTQINAQVACYLSPGSWMFNVRTPNTNSTSTYPISIVASSSCQ